MSKCLIEGGQWVRWQSRRLVSCLSSLEDCGRVFNFGGDKVSAQVREQSVINALQGLQRLFMMDSGVVREVAAVQDWQRLF